jgi:hypothetical protein
LRQTLLVVAAWEGKALKYSTIGKQLDITCPAAKTRVQYLAQARLIRLLHALEHPAGRAKTRKSPKLYLTGAGRSLLPSTSRPARNRIPFRSGMIRTVCSLEASRSRFSTFWYYGGYGKTHVELIVQTPCKRIGFVFLEENRLSRWDWSYCKRIFRRGLLHAAFVLYPGHRIFFAADRLVVLPAEEFFTHYRRWLNACLGSSRKLLLRMVRTYNTTHAGAPFLTETALER